MLVLFLGYLQLPSGGISRPPPLMGAKREEIDLDDFNLAGNPFLYFCFDPGDSPGPERHWPWELSFGDTLIHSAA